jgi:hypothetical protein
VKPDVTAARLSDAGAMADREHTPLCTIELIADGHADRCSGEQCAFWAHGCVLTRIQAELGDRPEVARHLLDLRRELEAGREVTVAAATQEFHRRLGAGRE